MQVILPSNRTVLLNSSLNDPHAWIPWLENKVGNFRSLQLRHWRNFSNSRITDDLIPFGIGAKDFYMPR